jgi:hypothetical protein
VTQGNPLFLHSAQRRNRRVGSLDATVLKLPGKLCAYCNNTRTQPHDLAWEKLSAGLRTWNPALGAGTIVWSNHIFGADRVREMLNVHLYFVKLFGCHIAGNNIPIDIAGFADAIMQGKPHPHVYLKFWCGRRFDGKPLVGMTDMWIAPPPIGGLSPFATWFYDLGFVGINVMYAVPGEKRQGLVGAWHPRLGATRLTISEYHEDAVDLNVDLCPSRGRMRREPVWPHLLDDPLGDCRIEKGVEIEQATLDRGEGGGVSPNVSLECYAARRA